MTNEEAINHIKDLIVENNSIKPNMVVFELEKEALWMAIEALEKQIPQKPKRFKNAFWEGYSCPECSESVSIINGDGYETPQYCKWCGVKLDWNDRDDN